jgi:hypothetical protein
VNGKINSLARLAAVAVLVAAVGAACGRSGDRGPAGAGAPTQTAQATQAATPAGPEVTPLVETPAPTDAQGSLPSVDQTPDPLTGDLGDIDSLINGINSSLSGNDSAGGE